MLIKDAYFSNVYIINNYKALSNPLGNSNYNFEYYTTC